MIVLSWFFSSPWTEITAFDHFLEAMPEACNEILSNYVNSNGKSLGAIDLEISYNYKLFLEEYNQGGRKSEIALLKKICDIDQGSIPLTWWVQNELQNDESYIHWEFITIIVNTTFREWYWNIQCVKASCIWNGCLWRGYSICTSSHMLFFLCQSLCLSLYNTRHHLAVRFSQQLANCFVIGTILVLSLEPKSISGGRRRGWKKMAHTWTQYDKTLTVPGGCQSAIF